MAVFWDKKIFQPNTLREVRKNRKFGIRKIMKIFSSAKGTHLRQTFFRGKPRPYKCRSCPWTAISRQGVPTVTGYKRVQKLTFLQFFALFATNKLFSRLRSTLIFFKTLFCFDLCGIKKIEKVLSGPGFELRPMLQGALVRIPVRPKLFLYFFIAQIEAEQNFKESKELLSREKCLLGAKSAKNC